MCYTYANALDTPNHTNTVAAMMIVPLPPHPRLLRGDVVGQGLEPKEGHFVFNPAPLTLSPPPLYAALRREGGPRSCD